jgi:hypothetical protein
MNFYPYLAYSEIAGHLLIHLAGDHQQHYLQLARRERFKPLTRFRNIALDHPPVSIAFNGAQKSIKRILIVKWLGKELQLRPVSCHEPTWEPGYYDNR